MHDRQPGQLLSPPEFKLLFDLVRIGRPAGSGNDDHARVFSTGRVDEFVHHIVRNIAPTANHQGSVRAGRQKLDGGLFSLIFDPFGNEKQEPGDHTSGTQAL